MAVSNGYAQTNVQLFNQLRCAGYSQKERQRVFEAYEFAMRIFSGLFLPSGKPFIDHLVCTASILVNLRVPVEIVAAGVIHAAYLHGDFGAIKTGFMRANRQRVRDVVGEKIEEYVAGYHRLLWTPQRIVGLHDTIDELSPVERNLVVMRLANELEHHLDAGALYYARSETEQQGHQRYLERYWPLFIAMAERSGYASLACDMKEAFRSVTLAEAPITRPNLGNQKGAYLIAPKSYRVRAWVALCRTPLRRFLKGARRRYGKYRRQIDQRLRKPLQRLGAR